MYEVIWSKQNVCAAVLLRYKISLFADRSAKHDTSEGGKGVAVSYV